jgi:hypothetical protein
MNLEFLQSLVNNTQKEILKNQFQQEYAHAKEIFETAILQIENELENNQEFQQLQKIVLNIKPPYSDEDEQVFSKSAEIVNETDRKYQWHQKNESYVKARWRLLVKYGEYVTALPACPVEIRDLFKAVQFKKMLREQLGEQLEDMAMGTQWQIV